MHDNLSYRWRETDYSNALPFQCWVWRVHCFPQTWSINCSTKWQLTILVCQKKWRQYWFTDASSWMSRSLWKQMDWEQVDTLGGSDEKIQVFSKERREFSCLQYFELRNKVFSINYIGANNLLLSFVLSTRKIKRSYKQSVTNERLWIKLVSVSCQVMQSLIQRACNESTIN